MKRRLTYVERQALMETLPGVIKLLLPLPCEGLKWSKMSRKAYFEHLAGNTPKKVKCKNRAWWQLKAAKSNNPWGYQATSGNYCWSHLAMQIDGSEIEHEQWLVTLREHYPDIWEEDD